MQTNTYRRRCRQTTVSVYWGGGRRFPLINTRADVDQIGYRWCFKQGMVHFLFVPSAVIDQFSATWKNRNRCVNNWNTIGSSETCPQIRSFQWVFGGLQSSTIVVLQNTDNNIVLVFYQTISKITLIRERIERAYP